MVRAGRNTTIIRNNEEGVGVWGYLAEIGLAAALPRILLPLVARRLLVDGPRRRLGLRVSCLWRRERSSSCVLPGDDQLHNAILEKEIKVKKHRKYALLPAPQSKRDLPVKQYLFVLIVLLATSAHAQCNTAPSATNDATSAHADPVLVDVLANDLDDGQALTVTVIGNTSTRTGSDAAATAATASTPLKR